MHFNLLCNSYPTVPLYADGYELLASGAFLTSVSVPKNKLFDTLERPPERAAVRPLEVCSSPVKGENLNVILRFRAPSDGMMHFF